MRVKQISEFEWEGRQKDTRTILYFSSSFEDKILNLDLRIEATANKYVSDSPVRTFRCSVNGIKAIARRLKNISYVKDPGCLVRQEVYSENGCCLDGRVVANHSFVVFDYQSVLHKVSQIMTFTHLSPYIGTI